MTDYRIVDPADVTDYRIVALPANAAAAHTSPDSIEPPREFPALQEVQP